MSTCRVDDRLEQTHDDDDRFAPPSSAQVNTPSGRATNHRPSASLTTAVSASRAFFDPWNSSSTGHQRAENRPSDSASWRTSRSLKLGEQYKSGITGGKRVACIVGVGIENLGKDNRKEEDEWGKGAKSLRTSGQQSLTEIWGARKAGEKFTSKGEASQAKHSLGSDHGTLHGENIFKGPSSCFCK